MTITQTLGALGGWNLQLAEETPDDVLARLGWFGHVVVIPAPVDDVEGYGDALRTKARYVGVLRARTKDRRGMAGEGMDYWLGDEDGKGDVIEGEIVLTNRTLAQAVADVVPSTVAVGTVYPQTDPSARYSGRHRYQSRRETLRIICDAFGAEWRINGDATIDVGTQAQLYGSVPGVVIRREQSGSDMDLASIDGEIGVDEQVRDFTTRIVIVGQTEETGDFAEGAFGTVDATYLDMRGNPLKITRLISEAAETTGSIPARLQLHYNRFHRIVRSLALQASEYASEGGPIEVGRMAYVYDPDTGIVNPNFPMDFRGEQITPDIIRVSGVTWPVTRGHTVAFRTTTGTWIDLTPYVVWEKEGADIIVGDLPASLRRPTDDPLALRVDASRPTLDTTIPNPPTALNMVAATTIDATGQNVSAITASWTPPTTNTDSSAITDLAYGLLRYRVVGRDAWQTAYSADNTVDVEAIPGEDYEGNVAAVDRTGNTSAWSAGDTVSTELDDTAPPGPANPVVTGGMGPVVKVTYLGTDNSAQPMPPDTNRIEVEAATSSSGPWTVVSSLDPRVKGTAYIDSLDYTIRWARLRAFDHAGNASAYSTSASGTPSRVVSNDIFDGAVGSAKLADLAVITAKIADLAVNDAKIGSLSVAKLLAGTITVDILNAGRVTTALTGARTELNGIGLQVRNASNALLVDLNGTSNLITGQLQSALSGTRLIINPGGAQADQIRFYPSTGAMYAKIETRTFSGQALIDAIAGSSRGDLAGGQFGCHPLEGYVRWGPPLATNPNAFVVAREENTQVSGPSVFLSVDERFSNDGGQRRMDFYRIGAGGSMVTASLLRLLWNATGYPWLAGVGADCGIVFQSSGAVGVVDNTGTATNIQASSFDFASSETIKEGIAPIAQAFDPMAVVRGAPSKKWQYIFERLRQGKGGRGVAPTRFGPTVEDLPAALRRSFVGPDGTAVPGTDLASLVGVLWGAVGQVGDALAREGILV